MAKNMPTASNGRSVARPAQGVAPARVGTTTLASQTAPNYHTAGKVGTAGRSKGKTVYSDTSFRN